MRRNTLQVLSSVMCIAEGIDTRRCDGVIWSRPRSSLEIIVQNIGRALRPQILRGAARIMFLVPLDVKTIAAIESPKERAQNLLLAFSGMSSPWRPTLKAAAELKFFDAETRELFADLNPDSYTPKEVHDSLSPHGVRVTTGAGDFRSALTSANIEIDLSAGEVVNMVDSRLRDGQMTAAERTEKIGLVQKASESLGVGIGLVTQSTLGGEFSQRFGQTGGTGAAAASSAAPRQRTRVSLFLDDNGKFHRLEKTPPLGVPPDSSPGEENPSGAGGPNGAGNPAPPGSSGGAGDPGGDVFSYSVADSDGDIIPPPPREPPFVLEISSGLGVQLDVKKDELNKDFNCGNTGLLLVECYHCGVLTPWPIAYRECLAWCQQHKTVPKYYRKPATEARWYMWLNEQVHRAKKWTAKERSTKGPLLAKFEGFGWSGLDSVKTTWRVKYDGCLAWCQKHKRGPKVMPKAVTEAEKEERRHYNWLREQKYYSNTGKWTEEERSTRGPLLLKFKGFGWSDSVRMAWAWRVAYGECLAWCQEHKRAPKWTPKAATEAEKKGNRCYSWLQGKVRKAGKWTEEEWGTVGPLLLKFEGFGWHFDFSDPRDLSRWHVSCKGCFAWCQKHKRRPKGNRHKKGEPLTEAEKEELRWSKWLNEQENKWLNTQRETVAKKCTDQQRRDRQAELAKFKKFGWPASRGWHAGVAGGPYNKTPPSGERSSPSSSPKPPAKKDDDAPTNGKAKKKLSLLMVQDVREDKDNKTGRKKSAGMKSGNKDGGTGGKCKGKGKKAASVIKSSRKKTVKKS